MEKILVVVTHHLAVNGDYLMLVVDRLLRQKGIGTEFALDLNVLCTDYDGVVYDALLPFRKDLKLHLHYGCVYDGPDFSTATKKGNWAIEHFMNETHDRVLFCSDDVYPALNAIQTMLKEPKPYVVNILSNSDIGGLVHFPLNIPNSLSVEDLSDKWKEALDGDTPGLPLAVLTPMVPFFFTMIGRETIEKVGYLNNDFDSAGNDMEYCHRVRAKGGQVVLSFKSLVVHFNGKTLKHTTSEKQRGESLSDAHIEVYGRYIYRKGVRKECLSPQKIQSTTSSPEE